MDRPGERQFALYALLAACAVLFRSEFRILFFGTGHSNVTWTIWLPIVGALAVFVRPGDLRALLLLYVGVLADVVHVLPESPNHWLLTAIVAVSWLSAAGAATLSGGRLPTGAALLRSIQLPFQVAIAVFYLFTGLWKLNSGFIDLTASCGVLSWDRLVAEFPFLPQAQWVDYSVLAFTWVLELVGPVLLLWRPTRRACAAFLAFFHLVLALDLVQNYQNFSWAMFPLLLLYFEPEDVDALPGLDALLPFLRRAVAGAFVGLIALAMVNPGLWLNLRWTFSVAMASGVVFVLVSLARVGAFPVPLPRVSRAAWVFLALVVFNGLTPVLGIKNRNAWQMYSNVRIEPGYTNHWLFPRSFDLLGLQADQVEILDVGNALLYADYVNRGLTLTWWDFRALLAQQPETSVRYRRAGQVIEVGTRDPSLAPPPRLARMFVWFRPQGELVARQCVW